jgi:hypothetical protein
MTISFKLSTCEDGKICIDNHATICNWSGIRMENADSPVVRIQIPPNVSLAKPHTTHIILQVKDNGDPELFRYRRFILHIMPSGN